MVGADGVHSVVRDALFGNDAPAFTGRVAYRTVFPATLLDGYQIDDCTKWWGPDRHIVIYYVKPDRSEVYFVTSQPEPGFALSKSWSATGDVNVVARRPSTASNGTGVADALSPFRVDAQAPHLASPARLANQHLASQPNQSGLGLRL